ncbi:MAG: tripartite tricarboxylate transporter substrate binding protein [Betaproteobacteria bacterium]|nr:tripartite tricarboxylate transporter substrate binding protein [Betaproteobacteria bacterium]
MLSSAMVLVGNTCAQTYPAKPIRMIVPFAAGGPADATARTLAPRLSEFLGQQIIVDNRGGAGGILGIDLTAKAPPDGHTTMLMSSSFVIFPSTHRTLPYDTFRDIAPITDVVQAPFTLVIHPSLPVRNAGELAKLARAKPGELLYPSAGVGGTNHLAGVQFSLLAGVKTEHVPYKGTGPALMDLAAGHVHFQFSMVLAVAPLVQAGRLRMIGIASAQRLADFPDVPTVAESGVPGYESGVWFGFFTGARVPRDIVGRLHGETVRVLALPAVRERLSPGGAQLGGRKPDDYAVYLRNEVAKWAKVVKAAGITPE